MHHTSDPFELTRKAATEHVALEQPSRITQPVDNPVDSNVVQLFQHKRIILVGSPEWPLREIVPRVVLDWWVNNDKPRITAAFTTDTVGDIALRTINPNIALHEIIAPEAARNPLRKLIRRMLSPGVERAFVFRWNDDPIAAAWIQELHDRDISTTLVGYDIIDAAL